MDIQVLLDYFKESILLTIVAVVFFIAFIVVFFLNLSNKKKIYSLIDTINNLEKDNASLKISLKQEQSRMATIRSEHSEEIRFLNDSYTKELGNLNTALVNSFDEALKHAQDRLVNINAKQLGDVSKEIVTNTLNEIILPLQSEISVYSNKSQELNSEFHRQFEQFKDFSQDISQRTQNLANAINGNKKISGGWGKSQLDFVLENSGLILGVNYQKQVCVEDVNNTQVYLDAIVDFGDNRKIIIDASCPMLNYFEFENNATNENAINAAKDVRNHIEQLSKKDYKKYNNEIEYVFMFFPHESMLNVVLATDKNLYEYACKNGIFLASPQSLLMTLRIVYICWQNIKIDQDARKIFDLVDKLNMKLNEFLSEYDALGNSINSSLQAHNLLREKLLSSNAKESLISNLEDIKNLANEACVAQQNKYIYHGEFAPEDINTSADYTENFALTTDTNNDELLQVVQQDDKEEEFFVNKEISATDGLIENNESIQVQQNDKDDIVDDSTSIADNVEINTLEDDDKIELEDKENTQTQINQTDTLDINEDIYISDNASDINQTQNTQENNEANNINFNDDVSYQDMLSQYIQPTKQEENKEAIWIDEIYNHNEETSITQNTQDNQNNVDVFSDNAQDTLQEETQNLNENNLNVENLDNLNTQEIAKEKPENNEIAVEDLTISQENSKEEPQSVVKEDVKEELENKDEENTKEEFHPSVVIGIKKDNINIELD